MNKPSCDVFLSHDGHDKPAVEALARRLKEKGINPWLDKLNLIPGDPWQENIEKALDKCAACAVFIGPRGAAGWHHEEMRAAIARRVEERDFRVIPVLLPGGEREQRKSLPKFLAATTWVVFERTLDDEDAFYRLVCGIRGIEPGVGPGPAKYEGNPPYRGLEVFQAEHAQFFCGREKLTDDVIDYHLRPRWGSRLENRFLAVVGASGSGKSSLVRAGLIPALRQGKLEGSADWPIVICRPGSDPLHSLATALANHPVVGEAIQDVARFTEALRDDQRTLHLTTRLALQARPETQRLFLLVDQFEEIFTMCREEKLRKALVDNLLYAATVVGGKTVVVLTLRVDFIGKCMAYRRLAAALSEQQELVPAMREHELRRAIERPANLVGCEIEPGLTEMLLQDVKNQAGALPLLEYTLMELWERREGRRLTISAYRAIGELQGALEKQANEVFDVLTPLEQGICKRIFLRLIQPGEETEDTKRRVMMKELEESDAVAPVLKRLIEARLITAEGKEPEKDQAGDVLIEVSHEALIQDWSKLREWIDADREAVRLEHRLSEAAKEWDRNGRDAAFLYRGARLAQAEEWRETHGGEAVALELEFLDASVALRDSEQREKQRQQRRKFWYVGAVAALATVIAVGAVLFSFHLNKAKNEARQAEGEARQAEGEARRAEEQTAAELAKRFWVRGVTERDRKGDWLKASHYLMRAAEVAKASTSSNDAYLAGALVAKASTISNDAYLAGALLVRPVRLTGILQHRASVSGALFSASGTRVLSWSDDGNAWLWDSQSGNELATMYGGEGLKGAVFSEDETRILTWSKNGTARLWDSETGKRPTTTLQLEGKGLRGARFSPNERQILTWGKDGIARLWDTASGQELKSLPHKGPVSGALFSETKPRVLTWSKDGTAKLWSSDTAEILASMRHKGVVWGATFSQDERWVLTWSYDKTARLWDADTGDQLSLFEHDRPVRGGTFGQLNTKVLTWSDDGAAALWNAVNGKNLADMRHDGPVRGATFGRDERWILTWSDDKTARLWDAESGQLLHLFEHDGPVRGARFSPDGQLVLTWSEASARIWSSGDGQRLSPALRHPSRINQALFDAEGDQVLTAGKDGTVRVWSVENPKQARAVMCRESAVMDVIYTRGSAQVVSACVDGTIWEWDSEKGPSERTKLKLDGRFSGARFAEDGSKLLTWSGDGTARLWSTADGDEVIDPLQHEKKGFGVLGAVFSPDKRRILSWSDAGTARVWDSGNGETSAEVSYTDYSVSGAVFSADGRRVVRWSDDGTVLLWRSEVLAPPLLRLKDAKLRVSAAVFSGDGQRVLLLGSDGSARFWDSTSGELDEPLSIHDGRIDGAVLSRDQRSVLTWSADATVRLWAIDSGKPIMPALPHDGERVNGAVFNSDETRILTWAEDGTARVWSRETGQPLTLPMKHDYAVNGARFLPDENWIMTWAVDSTVRLWSLEVDESGFDKPVLHTKLRTGTRLTEEREELKILDRKEWQDAR